MNITEELISTLAEMTPKEFNFYVAMMESLSEGDEVFKRLDSIIETKLKEFDTNQGRLEHASLYYLGFNHGMEEGIRIVKDEVNLEGSVNVT